MKKSLLCLFTIGVLATVATAEPKPGRGYFKKRYATPEAGIEMLLLSLGTIGAGLAFKKRFQQRPS